MKYFDVLMTVSAPSGSVADMGFYKVQCFQVESREMALKGAARWVRRRERECPSEKWTVLDAQPSGAFDNFTGKYVGQFIDEAFPLCEQQGN